MDPRWMVVDRNGVPIEHLRGMFRLENAQNEADELNVTGVAELRPYEVVGDPEA